MPSKFRLNFSTTRSFSSSDRIDQKLRRKIWKSLVEDIVVVVVVVSSLIQLNPRAHNVSRPWREPHRQVRVEVNQTRESTLHYRGSAHVKVPGRGTVRMLLSCLSETWRSWAREDHAGPRPPRRPRATSCDRITDVARHHNTGRPHGNQNSRGLNPAPGEHTRWAVLSLDQPSLDDLDK